MKNINIQYKIFTAVFTTISFYVLIYNKLLALQKTATIKLKTMSLPKNLQTLPLIY